MVLATSLMRGPSVYVPGVMSYEDSGATDDWHVDLIEWSAQHALSGVIEPFGHHFTDRWL